MWQCLRFIIRSGYHYCIRLNEGDSFAIDMRDCFGLASGCGIYGRLGDAGAQIMRSHGIGPISKWVDDHIFFRILCCHLDEYNFKRRQWAQDITGNGGELHDGGRLWFKGAVMPKDQHEEFDKDSSCAVRDLSQASERFVRFLLCPAPLPPPASHHASCPLF